MIRWGGGGGYKFFFKWNSLFSKISTTKIIFHIIKYNSKLIKKSLFSDQDVILSIIGVLFSIDYDYGRRLSTYPSLKSCLLSSYSLCSQQPCLLQPTQGWRIVLLWPNPICHKLSPTVINNKHHVFQIWSCTKLPLLNACFNRKLLPLPPSRPSFKLAILLLQAGDVSLNLGPSCSNDRIKISTMNVRSIKPKTAPFSEYVTSKNLNIVAVTETWLKLDETQ